MNKLAYLLFLPLVAANDHVGPSGSTLSLRPVRWSVVGGSAPIDVIPGRSAAITIQADIAKGWHVYSLTQKAGGPIPLSIQLIDAGDVSVRGVVRAPKPERTFDKNFGIETELYSGRPRFTIPVAVPGRSPAGTRKIQVGARYQVCSATLCLPPRTDKLTVTLRVRDRK